MLYQKILFIIYIFLSHKKLHLTSSVRRKIKLRFLGNMRHKKIDTWNQSLFSCTCIFCQVHIFKNLRKKSVRSLKSLRILMDMNDKNVYKINHLGLTYEHSACFESFIQCENDQETTQRIQWIWQMLSDLWPLSRDMDNHFWPWHLRFSKYLEFSMWHAFPVHFFLLYKWMMYHCEVSVLLNWRTCQNNFSFSLFF